MRSNIRTEQEIMKNWTGNVCLSISCCTYNHEKFIEDALEGFLIQETKFPFEILIHDDASTDNTANIIKDYEKAYPHIIKPIYQKENQFSQFVNITSKYQISRAQGQYIAMCEGDDYWTDRLKLQKLVDFLEKNNDYAGCAHDVDVIDEHKQIKQETPYGNYHEDLLTINDQIKYNNLPSLSLVFRKQCFNHDLFIKLKENTKYIGDIQLKCMILSQGKIKYFKEKMGTYRSITSSGTSFSAQKPEIAYKDTVFAYLNVYMYLKQSRCPSFLYIIGKQIKHYIEICKANKDTESIDNLIKYLKSKNLYYKLLWNYLRFNITPKFLRKKLYN